MEIITGLANIRFIYVQIKANKRNTIRKEFVYFCSGVYISYIHGAFLHYAVTEVEQISNYHQ